MINVLGFFWTLSNAFFARLDGGIFKLPTKWIGRLLCIAPFIFSSYYLVEWWGLIAAIGLIGLCTGHGQYFLGNEDVKQNGVEGVDFIVQLFFGKDPRAIGEYVSIYGVKKLYWRCVFGMFVTGFLVGFPAAMIGLYFGNLAALLFLLTGFAKSIAYMIGHKMFGNTESAEWLNGALRGLITFGIMII